jgi:hypothetical protein
LDAALLPVVQLPVENLPSHVVTEKRAQMRKEQRLRVGSYMIF